MTERLTGEEACALLGAAWRVLREVDIGMPMVGPENMAVIGEGDDRWIVRREVAAIIDTLRARLAEVERERDEAVQRARVAEAERDVWKADALARAAQAGDAGRGGGVRPSASGARTSSSSSPT